MRSVIRAVMAATVILCAGAASAQVHWYVTGTFAGGGGLFGEFDINSYGYVDNSYIVASGGGIYPLYETYGTAGTSTDNDATSIGYYRDAYTDALTLRFADTLKVGSTYNALLATSFECRDDNGCPYETTGGYRYLASGYASVNPITAVPEPGAWGMMIAGFGAIGALLRRRRGRAAAA